MDRKGFSDMACSIARTLDVVGDAWTPLILRDVYLGITRFDAIQADLEVSRKVLARRLAELVDHGVLQRVPYQDNPPRYDYWLTEKGADLAIVLLAMKAWGDRWTAGESGPPLLLRHESCGELTDIVPACSCCGEPLTPATVTPLLGPGARSGPGTRAIVDALARLAR